MAVEFTPEEVEAFYVKVVEKVGRARHRPERHGDGLGAGDRGVEFLLSKVLPFARLNLCWSSQQHALFP